MTQIPDPLSLVGQNGLTLAEMIGPMLVAIATVPLFDRIKEASRWLHRQRPAVQQFGVLFLASLLTWVGTTLQIYLPNELALFSEADTSALLSAGIAYAIHAGKKASGAREEAESAKALATHIPSLVAESEREVIKSEVEAQTKEKTDDV